MQDFSGSGQEIIAIFLSVRITLIFNDMPLIIHLHNSLMLIVPDDRFHIIREIESFFIAPAQTIPELGSMPKTMKFASKCWIITPRGGDETPMESRTI